MDDQEIAAPQRAGETERPARAPARNCGLAAPAPDAVARGFARVERAGRSGDPHRPSVLRAAREGAVGLGGGREAVAVRPWTPEREVAGAAEGLAGRGVVAA